MLWIALLPSLQPPLLQPLTLVPPPEGSTGAGVLGCEGDFQRDLAWWSLRYSPRVARLEEAVLIEVQASVRLFGGEPALLRELGRGARALGVRRMGVAPTAHGALALARAAPEGRLWRTRAGDVRWQDRLDALPLATLGAARACQDLLVRLGCRRLGDVRALPRAGLSRRVGAGLLHALDQAYGRVPESFEWQTLPSSFEQRLECPGWVEQASGLLHGARRLLQSLQCWLQARQAGVQGVVLTWTHDPRRGAEPSGHLSVATATVGRDMAHLERLLAEHLAQVVLQAPVVALSLQAQGVQPWSPDSASLLLHEAARAEPLQRGLERLAARLGAHRVLAGGVRQDHRPEHMQHWFAATGPTAGRQPQPPSLLPLPHPEALPPTLACQPPWLLPEPLALPLRGDRPCYHGVLSLVAGPERIEAGWWRGGGDDGSEAALAERDYFIARSERSGLLWVFRQRGPQGRGDWYLHGVFG